MQFTHIYDDYNRRESNMNWPCVHKFPDKWQKHFNQVIDNVIRPQLQSTPLSKWTSTSHQQWIHFIDVDSGTVTNETGSGSTYHVDISLDHRQKILGIKNNV